MKGNQVKNKRVNPFIHLRALLWWLNSSLIGEFGAHNDILKVVSKIENVYYTRGKSECIKYTKDLRLRFMKFIFDKEHKSQQTVTPKLPKILRSYKRRLENKDNYPLMRLMLSSLYLTRFIRLTPEPSFKSITERPLYEGNPRLLTSEMIEFVKDLGFNTRYIGKVPKTLCFKSFHMTSKSGPNGHALWNSYIDTCILTPEQRESIKILGGQKLYDLSLKFLQLYQKIPQFFQGHGTCKGPFSTRRISCIADKEGKTREIAILDYWSQAALKPLHKYIFKILSRIDQDCTHDQQKLLGKLIPTQGSSFHSIDLSNATDRFPIEIEWVFLRVMFGNEYADAWKQLMVGNDFHYGDQLLKYSTGNPMGAYSSFATFAICHHFFVWLACKRANRRWKRCPYMLLGDDIVIADDKVAEEYKGILSEWNIPFSKEKTHTSKYAYEFAKQVYLDDVNISPFPLASLYERRNSPIESVGIIRQEVIRKDWHTDLLKVLKKYFIQVLRWERPRFRYFQPKLNLVLGLLSALQGLSDLGPAIEQYVADWTKQDFSSFFSRPLGRGFAKWIAVKTIQRLFEESRDKLTSNDDGKSLGELSTLAVIYITSLESEEEQAKCFDWIEAVPFLQIYGRAEETYLSLKKDLNDTGLGTKMEHLRDKIGKVDIPMSDRDFYVRHRDVLIIQALKSGNIMEELIKDTAQVISWNGRLDFTLPWWEFTTAKEEDLLEDRRMPPRVKPGD